MSIKIIKTNLVWFLLAILLCSVILILIILRKSDSTENVKVIFQREYKAYLKGSKQDYEESPVSSSSLGPRGFKHMHNITKLGPVALPYSMEKMAQTKDMNFTVPISIISRKRFSKSEWPEGKFGDSRTLALLYIDWWEKGRKLTPLQFTERYARWKELRDGDKVDEAAECRDEIRKLGIAGLPMIMEKVKQGDIELIPVVNKLTDDKVEATESTKDCLAWWRENKEKWLIPFPNNRPVANAGQDRTVTSGDTVQLDGSASSDEDNDELTYSWTQIKGLHVELSDETVIIPTFTAPTVKRKTVLEFQLIVNDAGDVFKSCPTPVSLSEPDVVKITVKRKEDTN